MNIADDDGSKKGCFPVFFRARCVMKRDKRDAESLAAFLAASIAVNQATK